MKRSRVWSLVAWMPLLTIACSNQLKVQDAGPFGPVRSAVWVESTKDSQIDDIDHTSHPVIVSNRPGLCSKIQEAADVVVAYSDLWFTSSYDEGAEAQCALLNDYANELETIFDGSLNDGGKQFAFEFTSEGEWKPGRPAEGTHDVSADDGGRVSGTLLYSGGEYYRSCRDEFTPDCGSFSTPSIDYCCWVYTVDNHAIELYGEVKEGEFQVEFRGDDAIRVDFDASIFDYKSDDYVTLEGGVTADRCPIELTLEYNVLDYFEPFASVGF